MENVVLEGAAIKACRPAIILCVLLLASATASAELIEYDSRATFEAAGTIAENCGYSDLAQNATPGTAYGITYAPQDLAVIPGGGGYEEPISTVVTAG
jgi:hypothetical protein